MRLLLGSGGYRTPDRVASIRAQMRDFFGDVERLLFVPYAQADYAAYLASWRERGLDGGYPISGIHETSNPAAAVRAAPGLVVGGGNTFRLLAALYELGLLEVIRERVRGGMPYLGISAGCNVACPTIRTTNDMPIAWPPSSEALGLVWFQVNPHYFEGETLVRRGGEVQLHFGETRDERLREFHELNATPVVGLWEGGALRVEDERVRLAGAPARLFRRGEAAIDLEPGADLSDLVPRT